MGQEAVLDAAQEALWTALLIAAPILTVALLVGLLISLFQVVTQIQEMTLTFVPKILAIAVTLLVLGHWMLATLTDFSIELFKLISQ